MSAARSIAAGVLGIAVAAALVAFAWLHRPVEQVHALPPEPGSGASRIYYPADKLPRLAVPGQPDELVHSVLNVPARMQYGEWVWDESGVPQGHLWIRVDLKRQLLSVFRAGHEIGTAVILYGVKDKQTPLGVHPVLEKVRDYHSRTYDAPMPYMLRLTADGVAIHGAEVRRGAATHGCIGVPTAFASQLYDRVKLGDRVEIIGAQGAR